MKRKVFGLGILAAAALAVSPERLTGCGPFFETTLFTLKYHPTFPLDQYAAGRLGVVKPTLYREFLFVGYRYLSAKPMTEEERASLSQPSPPGPAQAEAAGSHDQFRVWLDARARIAGLPAVTQVSVFRKLPGSDWQSYVNCNDDAFQNAATTLERRLQTFGAAHAGISAWVQAQDAVFSNCAGGEAIPPAPEAGLPALLKADRMYQTGAAYFYAEKFDEAERRFRDIASDPGSPWSKISPYLAARAMIRKSTLSSGDGKFDRDALSQAEKLLASIVEDPARKEIHGAARRLLDFAAVRLRPADRLRELTKELTAPSKGEDLRQKLVDYERLLTNETLDGATVRDSGDLTDWILNFRAVGEVALAHSLVKWKETGSSAWLLSCAVKISSVHPESGAILQALAGVARGSPAFGTAAFHRIRLLEESGQKDSVRQVLDALLPDLRASMPPSSLNLFLAQRMKLARTLDEFLRFAPRMASGIESVDGEEPWHSVGAGAGKQAPPERSLFDSDSAGVFSRAMPLAMLRRAATGANLPAHLKKQLVTAAWVRAVLLDRHETARLLSEPLGRFYPELRPLVDRYGSASSLDEGRFAAVHLLLKAPGLKPYCTSGIQRKANAAKIDAFRDNWWCSFSVRTEAAAEPERPVEFPEFVTDAERAAFRREWEKLLQLDTAPNYFGQVVLSWARNHPGDPRAPEALHLVVKATRFGCVNQASGKYSQACFQLLHRKYPESAWAKLTKYWYGSPRPAG